MADEQKPPGFLFVHQFVLDPDVSEHVQVHYNAPPDATPVQLAAKLRDVSVALWTRRLVTNDRTVERTKIMQAERERRVHDAQQKKLKLDLRSLAEEDTQIRTALVRLESQQAADRAALARDQAMTDDDIVSLVQRVERSTFGETEH